MTNRVSSQHHALSENKMAEVSRTVVVLIIQIN